MGSAQATLVGKPLVYTAQEDDTFADIGERFDVGFVPLRAANPDLDPWVPGAGKEIRIPTQSLVPDGAHNGILINLAEMRLYYFKSGPTAPPEVMAIGVGREGLDTPRGQTKIMRKVVGPTWHPTPRMLEEDPTLPLSVPAGEDNPLGTHAMYLDWPAYLIHGTNKSWGIGRRTSSGCIRLYPKQIKELFGMVPIGTPVSVVYQPIKLNWEGNDLWLEAHPERDQADQIEMDYPMQTIVPADILSRVQTMADDAEIDWAMVDQQLRARNGLPVMIGRRKNAPIAQTEPTITPINVNVPASIASKPAANPITANANDFPITSNEDVTEEKEDEGKAEDVISAAHAPLSSLAITVPTPTTR